MRGILEFWDGLSCSYMKSIDYTGAMRERFNNEINRVKNHMEDQVSDLSTLLYVTPHFTSCSSCHVAFSTMTDKYISQSILIND